MGSNNPVRQHYIPEFLLRNFSDDRGHLWVYDKGQRNLYATNAKNVFVKRNIYTTFRFEHIEKNTEFERFISSIIKDYTYEVEDFARDIEGNASPIISRVIDRARINQFPKLSQPESDKWKRFMLAMARRTPESRKRATSVSDDFAFYEAVKLHANKVNYDLPDREVLYQDSRVLKLKELVMANVHARFAAGDSPRERIEEERFCRETGLCIAVIRGASARNSFLIGSHGLCIVQSGGPGDPIHGSWLPIAHDVAILATSAPDKEWLWVLDNEKKDVVEKINAASDSQSQIIAGRSEELVRAFVVP